MYNHAPRRFAPPMTIGSLGGSTLTRLKTDADAEDGGGNGGNGGGRSSGVGSTMYYMMPPSTAT